jgi:hypothetical protein
MTMSNGIALGQIIINDHFDGSKCQGGSNGGVSASPGRYTTRRPGGDSCLWQLHQISGARMRSVRLGMQYLVTSVWTAIKGIPLLLSVSIPAVRLSCPPASKAALLDPDTHHPLCLNCAMIILAMIVYHGITQRQGYTLLCLLY